MTKVYLNFDARRAKFYEFHKGPVEGSEEYTNKDGRVSYRMYYYKGVYGQLHSIDERETKIGPALSINLVDGNITYICDLPLVYSNGNYTEFAKTVILTLPNLKKGEVYKFFPYSFIPAGDKYERMGVSIKPKEGDGFSDESIRFAYSFDEEDDNAVPKVEWVENKKGKREPEPISVATLKKFLKEVFEEHKIEWESDGSGGYDPQAARKSSSSSKKSGDPMANARPKITGPKQSTPLDDMDEDDLPF